MLQIAKSYHKIFKTGTYCYETKAMKTLSITLILLITLISCQSFLAQDQPHNYCNDKESWKEWDDLVLKYPNDMDIQALHALRVGLCVKVKNGTISFELATEIFNNMHEMVIAKKKFESQDQQGKSDL